jgi:hypothetical protein
MPGDVVTGDSGKQYRLGEIVHQRGGHGAEYEERDGPEEGDGAASARGPAPRRPVGRAAWDSHYGMGRARAGPGWDGSLLC